MIEKIIIAGAGGQGIMLLGKVLAEAAMQAAKFVTWLPAYGAEVRGGTAYCMVVISDQAIGAPYIEEADSLIVMNEPSLEKFKTRLKRGGLLMMNSSLIHQDVLGRFKVSRRPFTDIAVKLGNIKVANMVALGCYLAIKKPVPLETVHQVIVKIAPVDKAKLIEINQKALNAGVKLENENTGR